MNYFFPYFVSFILLFFCMSALLQRDEYRDMYKHNKQLLIDFGHARYISDPVTGKSDFQIDSPPVKTEEID